MDLRADSLWIRHQLEQLIGSLSKQKGRGPDESKPKKLQLLYTTATIKPTCGFMFGPGNPNAAIASMLGTPKGFPPIWQSRRKHKD